ncbi:hypothetical protein IAT38_000565 [Cryptococcus sp. DSM 104549]
MAKSIRAKAKMASRARKRQQSHYAATESARTQRLSDKLLGKTEGAAESEEADEGEVDAKMDEEPKKISTSGSRGARREQWRLAKGMSARPVKSAKGAGKNQRRR